MLSDVYLTCSNPQQQMMYYWFQLFYVVKHVVLVRHDICLIYKRVSRNNVKAVSFVRLTNH